MAVWQRERLTHDAAFLRTQRKLRGIFQSLVTRLTIGLPLLSFNDLLFYIRKEKGEIIMKKRLYKQEQKASLILLKCGVLMGSISQH